MALKYPLATGVWSNAGNWNGGTLPVAGDDVRANGFTVTIDVDINVLQISTAQQLPALAGGSFVVSTNRTLICDVNAGVGATLTSSVGNIINIIGNIYGGANFSQFVVNLLNTSTVLNVTGNAFGPTAGAGSGHAINSAGTVNFVGNATGIGSGTSAAINILATGNLTFTGTATGGNSSAGAHGILSSGNTILNGTINAGLNAASVGVRLNSGTHIINSDCFGGGVSGSHACVIQTSTATFNGNITGSTSTLSFGLSVLDTASNVVVSTMTFSPIGCVPISGFVKFKNTAPTIIVRKANNTNQTLVDATTTDIPTIANVRNGITYASGSLTGTLNVPPASSVAVGVPVDATVGTAIITVTDMGALLASYNV
jgi:hypothetical protein